MSENISEKISVQDFVDKINRYASKDAKNKYIESIVLKDKYVDYMTKVTLVRDFTNKSCLDQNGNVKMNSCGKYLMYVRTILSLYTKLELDNDNPSGFFHEFDMLNKYRIIDDIMKNVSKSELSEWDTIMSMCHQDLITNNYEIHGYISRNVDNIMAAIDKSAEPLVNVMIEKVKEMDTEDFRDMLNGIVALTNMKK